MAKALQSSTCTYIGSDARESAPDGAARWYRPMASESQLEFARRAQVKLVAACERQRPLLGGHRTGGHAA